jgi:hypothetical protein
MPDGLRCRALPSSGAGSKPPWRSADHRHRGLDAANALICGDVAISEEAAFFVTLEGCQAMASARYLWTIAAAG